ncbi:hypothetical protein CATMIT_01918, partial [Catenibacterium mitsuokai DSM 15897]
GCIERIQLVRTVDGDLAHGAAIGDQQGRFGHVMAVEFKDLGDCDRR